MTRYFRLLPYKIKIICSVWALVTLHFLPAQAQELKVVKKVKNYVQKVNEDSSYAMIELKSLDSTIIYDLRYATTNNFTGNRLYKQGRQTYLRKEAAQALLVAQKELRKQGLGIKIFDAYRPYAATKKMWELIKDEKYVANPAKGSNHNRGLAVDLTIVELTTGRELNMGTAFDNFTDTAHHAFKDLSATILANRQLLKTVMEKSGFRSISSEWWHYNWPNNKNYDVLDIDFAKFRSKDD